MGTPTKAKRRSLRNVRLTRDLHFRYMGLWMIVTGALIVCVNVILYLWMQERCLGLQNVISSSYVRLLEFREHIVGAMVIETLVFIVGIVALGKLTAHRVAGPYVRLKRVFKAVRDGDAAARLAFRKYDHLEDVARAFNEMMDAIARKQTKSN